MTTKPPISTTNEPLTVPYPDYEQTLAAIRQAGRVIESWTIDHRAGCYVIRLAPVLEKQSEMTL
jgi:hypothetical protein